MRFLVPPFVFLGISIVMFTAFNRKERKKRGKADKGFPFPRNPMIREIGFWLALLSLLTRRDRTAIETEEKEESLRYPPPSFSRMRES